MRRNRNKGGDTSQTIPEAEWTEGRLSLVRTAERSLALYGVDGVSISKIVKEAGQRNSSAVHYHFGNRSAMIREIFRYRLHEVDEIRRSLYERFLGDGLAVTVRDVVEVVVRPLATLIGAADGPSYYVRFIEQVTNHLDYRDFLQEGSSIATTFVAALDELRGLLQPLPSPVVEARIADFAEHMVSSLAQIEAVVAEGHADQLEFRVSNLIDVLTASLTAPMSARTAQLILGSGKAPGDGDAAAAPARARGRSRK